MNQGHMKQGIMTVPEEIKDIETLCLTGNEYISLPEIDSAGAIRNLNVLHLGHRGLLEFCGSKTAPLIAPFLTINDSAADMGSLLSWDYRLDWIPSFSMAAAEGVAMEGEIFAPPGFKGFCYRLKLSNKSGIKIRAGVGWRGCWKSFNYIVFNRREVGGRHDITYDRWTGSLVLEAAAGPPLAALALAAEPDAGWHFDQEEGSYMASHEIELKPGATCEVKLYVAANLEGDGAGTTAVDLRRHGAAALKELTGKWLESRRVEHDSENLGSLLNRNLFFSYFFAAARSLDSEELVPVTSRSPRYYVSAAFWSRDTLLWSFPAVMMADRDTARELLLTVFRRHIGNAGDHAHYINGSVLYPGFELDQLAAYFLALEHYLGQGGDSTVLDEEEIQKGLYILTDRAFEKFDPESGLYSTFLDPSDDPVHFPYLTYNNALLQCAFNFLARLQNEDRWQHKSDFAILARELQQAVYENCMVKGPFGMMFAWAVDGRGKFSLYDNPPGSLQLLVHYGFCSISDTVFNNTVRWIRSSNNRHFHQGCSFEEAGSAHAENPWPLAACNDLLACNAGAVDFLSRAEMDSGFFCETVNPDTGKVSTGAAFASGAGFLAYALKNRAAESKCSGDEPVEE